MGGSCLKSSFLGSTKTQLERKQESRSAWTQEAYRPPRSKYLLCWFCLRGGGRYPSPILAGKGVPRCSPSWVGGGFPQSCLGWGGVPTTWDWGTSLSGTGYPPRKGHGTWDWGTPGKGHGTRDRGTPQKGLSIMGWSTPFRWTDRQTENITFRHPVDAGANKPVDTLVGDFVHFVSVGLDELDG